MMNNTKAIVLWLLLLFPMSGIAENQCTQWYDWVQFKNNYMTQDGRIVDHETNEKISTSEGQSYALFFALVAGDRHSFDLILNWTNNNLSDGNLGEQLPAWKWGQTDNDEWHVLDANPASDADLWMSYTLLEASRLWNHRSYETLGKRLAEQILKQETVYLPGLGLTLLPAPYGFHPSSNRWRLNPSYLPIPLLRYLSLTDERWKSVTQSSLKIIRNSTNRNFAPNWTEYVLGKGIQTDRESSNKGSYDAIRVYLWAGMMNSLDPQRKHLLGKLNAMRLYVERHKVPPIYTNDPMQGDGGEGSIGFSAALLPFLSSSNSVNGLISQLSRLLESAHHEKHSYYSNVLSLFGLGWYKKRFHFGPQGHLQLRLSQPCS